MRDVAPVTVGTGDLQYEWIDDWARLPKKNGTAAAAWPHHGLSLIHI